MTASPGSPISHLRERMAATAGLPARLHELPPRDQLDLRAGAGTHRLLGAILDVDLPVRPNHWHQGPPEAYWLGPDEWLIVGTPDLPRLLEADLRFAVGGDLATAVDVSDQRIVLELAGPAAIEVLSGGCAIDLHPRAFGPGRCARTLLGRAGVLISRGEREDRFRLFVQRSFASYAVEWLLDGINHLDRPTA